MKAEIVPAEAGHIEVLADNARQADIDELWAQGRTTPRQALEYGLARSTAAFTGMVDGVPFLMFGAVPWSVLAGQGGAWMVGSRALDESLRHQKALLLRSRAGLAQLHRTYPVLFNAVDARNTCAIRWLRWLGFTLLPAMPHGPDGLLFHPFYRDIRHV